MTVVVATRDRPGALERCLTALVWQTARPLEIVVVDDASADADAVGRIVARTVDGFDAGDRDAPVVRVLRGDGRGPAGARNMGAREARGAIVGFTDDDCVPGPRWAERLAVACAGGDAAAGITVADPAAGRAAAASQLITRTLQLVSLDPQGGVGFAPSCNLACPAGVIRELPFDESFPLAAGEDRDWCSRLADAGVALRFVPEAVVEHRPELGLGALLRQQARYGRGAVRFRRAGEGRALSGRWFYGRLVREAAHAGPAIAALVAIAQVAVVAGAMREAAGSRR